MSKNNTYIYFTEGECEKKIIDVLKNTHLQSGKIRVYNVLQKPITDYIIRQFKEKSVVILVFDTDIETNLSILQKNITLLKSAKNIKNVILIPQIKNFEDEIIYSTNIKNIQQLLNSKSNKDFKSDFINCRNILDKLTDVGFDFSKFWSRSHPGVFKTFINESNKIKKS